MNSEEPWWERASCRGLAWRDDDPFHPDDGVPGRTLSTTYRYAARICFACPVLVECREAARKSDRDHGYYGLWAGMSPRARRTQDLEDARARNGGKSRMPQSLSRYWSRVQ